MLVRSVCRQMKPLPRWQTIIDKGTSPVKMHQAIRHSTNNHQTTAKDALKHTVATDNEPPVLFTVYLHLFIHLNGPWTVGLFPGPGFSTHRRIRDGAARPGSGLQSGSFHLLNRFCYLQIF